MEGAEDQHELPIRGAGQTPWGHRPHIGEAIVARDYNQTNRNLHMITLRSTAKYGGTFQKIRLLDVAGGGAHNVHRSPSFSPNESLGRRLCVYLHSGPNAVGPGVYIHSLWYQHLPRILGTSAALDATVACLVESHEAVVRGEPHSEWLDAKGYGQAIQAVQGAVDDPTEQYSTQTLAAIAVMWRIEGIFAASSGKVGKQAVHAAALAFMLKARGMRDCHKDLEFLLTLDCQLAAVQHCLVQETPQPCMFDSEEWDLVFEEPHGRSELSMMYWRVFREFVRWPGLIHDILLLYTNPTEAPATLEQIAQRALIVAANLERIGHTMEAALRNPKVCVTKPSSTGDPLVPIVFEFRELEAAPLLGYLCFYSIAINRMLIHMSLLIRGEAVSTPWDRSTSIPPDLPTTFPISAEYDIPSTLFSCEPPTIPFSDSTIDILRLRNVQMAQYCWMMYEQARTWKPVGCLFFINALKGSFPWAGSLEMKTWILEAAADVEDFLPNTTLWEVDKVERMGKVLSGEIIYMDEEY